MLFSGHLTIFTINFFYNASNPEIAMKVRQHIQLSLVKNESCGSLYFGIYTLWKIEFVASPEASQNQVFRVKTS